MRKLTLNAQSLRIILSVLMLLIVIGGATGLWYGLDILKTFAVEVSHKKVDATASNGNLRTLQTTQQYLDSNKDVLEKIGLLRSTSEFPEFRVVEEVQKVAAKNNVRIESFNYGSEATPSSGAAGSTSPEASTAPAAPSATETIALSVKLSAPSYLEFLQFTYDLEQHLPKMKINGIDVSGGGTQTEGAGSGGGTASVQSLTIEMYIK